MWRKIQFAIVFIIAFLAALSAGTQSGSAQSGFATAADPPLSFGNNYFVTGDYIVAGAYGMTSHLQNGFATGTITIPDSKNKGITGQNMVPPGAEVVVAELYWQTVEKVGQLGSGQNGTFRPLLTNSAGKNIGPPTGYPITGVNLPSHTTVSYSSGGCSGTSTGKVVQTYRANVLGALPRDASGNIAANGTYEIRLPSVGSNTPLTLGATLVIIYRVLSANVPLNSIVIYDGAFAPTASSPMMSQTVQGFYDASTTAANSVSRLTHIVGSGQSNKFETVKFNGAQLSSLYPGLPAFPGWYGSWDNPTWTLTGAQNPLREHLASVPTQVSATSSNQGCVSWGAIIVSTTVNNSDGDGLLDAWKTAPSGYTNPGYCDAAIKEGVCTPGDPIAWVDLPGAVLGQNGQKHPDIFVQLDYMCSSIAGPDSCNTGNGNYSFDPRPSGAIDSVIGAFRNHGITLHVDPSGTNQPNIHAVQEPFCTDNLNTAPPILCAFPGQAGVVAWKGGFDFFKSQLVDPDEIDPSHLVSDCTGASPENNCIPRFQPGKRYSWHHALFGHAVGQPRWKLQDQTLTSVSQTGNTVTFTTSLPVGTLNSIGNDANGNPVSDPTCRLNGRVTIVGAASNPNLGGTYCISSAPNPQGNSFTITVGGPATPPNTAYTFFTDPNLAVAPGQTGTASGISDVGGADSLITLGLWGDPTLPTSDGQKKSTLSGTFMHELGHSLGLTHGGFYFDNLTNNPSDYTPTIEANCKANYQSVMNYMFQVDLLDNLGLIFGFPFPLPNNEPDYSGEMLAPLTESSAGNAPFNPLPKHFSTSWYLQSLSFQIFGTQFTVPTPAKFHCNGTPITDGANYFRTTNFSDSLSWGAGQDINFDGILNAELRGYNDWANIDLHQIGATGSNSVDSGKQFNGGGGQFNGGGGQFNGGGGQFNGGGGQFNGGGGQFNGGGGQFNGGGGQFNGGGEIDVATVNSITRSARNLVVASEDPSPRTITLNWVEPSFGQIGSYNVYRSSDGGKTFNQISTPNTVTGTMYTDTPSGNGPPCTQASQANGYQYFVTAVLAGSNPPQESAPSNTVSSIISSPETPAPLTGCYTLGAGISSPASAVHGSIVPITWTVQDDHYTQNAFVNNLAPITNSLVAIGPFAPAACPQTAPTGPTKLLSSAGFSTDTNQFTFNWDTESAPFTAGCYFFKLTLDSGQFETTTSPLLLQIDVTDTDSTPHVTTTSLPDAMVGIAYSDTVTQDGAVGMPANFTWTIVAGSGSLPPGISLGLHSGILSGTPTVGGIFTFTVKVTDTVGNSGSQTLTLRVRTPVVSLTRTDFNTGQSPNGLIAADFNGDGKIDLATANSADSSVSILLGNGDGTFAAQPPLIIGAGSASNSLTAGDFNGDGILDLAVANFSTNNVSIFLGNGGGTFSGPVNYAVAGGPFFVITGDFNRDGILDLAVANQNGQLVSILLGNGDGTFQPNADYPAGGSAAPTVSAVALGDFDRDGKLDLAVTNLANDTVSVLLGNGDGTFQPPVSYSTGNPGDHPLAVSAVDLRGTGILDLAVTNVHAKTVAILLGNGDGSFQPRVVYNTTSSTSVGPGAIITGDFNADGKVDLAITNESANTVSILLGNGDGTLQNPLEFTTGTFAAGVAAGDFNGDGRLDLAVADLNANTVSVLLQGPLPPTNLAASGVTATQVTLGWSFSLSPTVAGYNVYRSTTSGTEYTKIGSVDANTTTFTDTTVVSGTTYYYVLTAADAGGRESVLSNQVSATPH